MPCGWQVNITRMLQFPNPTRSSVQFIVQAGNLDEAQSLAQVTPRATGRLLRSGKGARRGRCLASLRSC